MQLPSWLMSWYAQVFARTYDSRQSGSDISMFLGKDKIQNGAYAAVIPKWVEAMITNKPVYIMVTVKQSWLCYIDNTVQVNILAATAGDEAANQVYNVAVGDRTTLNDLFELIRAGLVNEFPHLKDFKPHYQDFRAGDVRHSLADISKAKNLLGLLP